MLDITSTVLAHFEDIAEAVNHSLIIIKSTKMFIHDRAKKRYAFCKL